MGDDKKDEKKNAIKCTVKTSPGWFFALSKSIIFVHKPVIHLSCSDITVVEF